MLPLQTSASFPSAGGCVGAALSKRSSESISRIKVPTDEKQEAARHPGQGAFPSFVSSRMAGPTLHSRIVAFRRG